MPKSATKKPRKPKRPEVELLPAGTVLLALDASSSVIGWAVFKGHQFGGAGLAQSPRSWDSERRIRDNTDEILEIIRKFGVTRIVMEWQSHLRAAGCRNANGLATLGQAQGDVRGVIRHVFPDIPIGLVSEREWTKPESGGRNLSKIERAESVKHLCPDYGLAIEKDPKIDPGLDMADAVGLGLWWLANGATI